MWRVQYREDWTTTMPSTSKPAPLTLSSMSVSVGWSSPTWLHSLRNAVTLSTSNMPRSTAKEATDDQSVGYCRCVLKWVIGFLFFFLPMDSSDFWLMQYYIIEFFFYSVLIGGFCWLLHWFLRLELGFCIWVMHVFKFIINFVVDLLSEYFILFYL